MRSKILFLTVLLVSSFFVGAAYAQNKSYLSHVVNGNYGEGSYKMTFVLFNNTDTDTTALLELTADNGSPLTLVLGGNTNSSFTIQLPAGSSQTLQSDGQGNVVVGAATVTCAVHIGVSAIFSIYDANGNFLTETGVGNSDPQTSFVLPVDTTGLFNTGLALFNVGTGSAKAVMTLRNSNGQQVGSTVEITLLGHNHIARFVSGAGQLFPAVGNFQGTLFVQCLTPIAALVLRENSSPLSFTSLPAVSSNSQSQTLNLAQLANGSYGTGSYKTTFLIFNIFPNTANVTLTLTNDAGNPLSVTIPGHGTNSTFSFVLAPAASLFLQTDGTGSVVTGAATITSSGPIGASAVFTVLNSQGGFQTETGVGDSPVLSSFTLPVDIAGNIDTGVAFFAAGGSSSTLTFRLLDQAGAAFGSSVTRSLPINGHLAIFVSQILPVASSPNSPPAASGGFKGSLAITATSGVAALTLRQNSSPLSFTTLPVVSGTSKGKTSSPGGRLLSKTDSGVNATSNITKDETLPDGFKLSGTVTGPGLGRSVYVITGSEVSFTGTVNRQTGAYSILLPGGTYTLKVGFTPNGVPAGHDVGVVTSVPGSVQVSADTTRDITFPLVAVFNVSGTVTGLSNLPPFAPTSPPVLLFTSTGDPTADASFQVNTANGSYQGLMAAGDYKVSLSSSWGFSYLGLLHLGSASISGSTVLPPFAVPAMAKLSGTVHGLGAAPFAQGADVGATDAPAGGNVTGFSLAGANGQYQLTLQKDVTYKVVVGASVLQGTQIWGGLSFPWHGPQDYGNSVSLGQDTANFDFTAPGLPATVIISGHVTDSSGKALANISVTAGSFSITGGEVIEFSTFGQTDAAGFYSLVVLSGTNYVLTFTPLVQ
jgi:hypothetical protein